MTSSPPSHAHTPNRERCGWLIAQGSPHDHLRNCLTPPPILTTTTAFGEDGFELRIQREKLVMAKRGSFVFSTGEERRRFSSPKRAFRRPASPASEAEARRQATLGRLKHITYLALKAKSHNVMVRRVATKVKCTRAIQQFWRAIRERRAADVLRGLDEGLPEHSDFEEVLEWMKSDSVRLTLDYLFSLMRSDNTINFTSRSNEMERAAKAAVMITRHSELVLGEHARVNEPLVVFYAALVLRHSRELLANPASARHRRVLARALERLCEALRAFRERDTTRLAHELLEGFVRVRVEYERMSSTGRDDLATEFLRQSQSILVRVKRLLVPPVSNLDSTSAPHDGDARYKSWLGEAKRRVKMAMEPPPDREAQLIHRLSTTPHKTNDVGNGEEEIEDADVPKCTNELLVMALEDVVERIARLTPSRPDLVESLRAGADVGVVKQMLENGVFSPRRDFVPILLHLGERLLALQAPDRNEATKAWLKVDLERLTGGHDEGKMMDEGEAVSHALDHLMREVKRVERAAVKFHVNNLHEYLHRLSPVPGIAFLAEKIAAEGAAAVDQETRAWLGRARSRLMSGGSAATTASPDDVGCVVREAFAESLGLSSFSREMPRLPPSLTRWDGTREMMERLKLRLRACCVRAEAEMLLRYWGGRVTSKNEEEGDDDDDQSPAFLPSPGSTYTPDEILRDLRACVEPDIFSRMEKAAEECARGTSRLSHLVRRRLASLMLWDEREPLPCAALKAIAMHRFAREVFEVRGEVRRLLGVHLGAYREAYLTHFMLIAPGVGGLD